MHDSKVIANQFIGLAKESGSFLTIQQLIKLVCLAEGWMLGLHNRSLIKEELEVWTYGPIISSLYEAVKRYRGYPITDFIPVKYEYLDEAELDIISQTYTLYGRLPVYVLCGYLNRPETPWDQYKNEKFGYNIPKSCIKKYYQNIYNKH